MVLDRRSFTLWFEFPVFAGDSEDSAKNLSRKPLEEERALSTSAGMEASEAAAAGFSWRSDASEEDEEESRRRWAEAERRRNIGKREPPLPPPPPFEFPAKLESALESSEVLREPEGVLVGLRAKTGTSVKCSEGIRI